MEYNGVSFSLKDSFIQKYKWKQPKFGPLGYFTFKRTYSRPISANKSEEFWQTLQRVTEGIFVIQKAHCDHYHLPWNERAGQKSAQEMYQRMWDFKFLPPGRGLWAMGSDFAFKKGGACLNNCGMISSIDIIHEFSTPFVWLMDMSLLGVGVGFDTKGAFQDKEVFLKSPRLSKEPHVVEDSREGWVATFKRVLDSYDGQDSFPSEFDYSLIRPEGSIIHGFGGIAPGAGPLIELVNRTVIKLDEYVAEEKPVDSTLIVDLMNFAGAAVVAGGIRRSSEIALGTMDDEEFNDLKSNGHLKDTKLARWASNNTHIVHKGDNYTEAAQRTAQNGEPGYFWIENARKYGRMKDRGNWKDRRVMGTNPCVTGDTLVLTSKGYYPINQFVDIPVSIWNGIEWSEVTPRVTGYNEPTVIVGLSDGSYVHCTNAHEWILISGKYNCNRNHIPKRVQATALNPGDKLFKYEMPVVVNGNKYSDMYCQGLYAGDGQGREEYNKGVLIYDYSKELIEVLRKKGCSIGEYQPKYKRTWAGMSKLQLHDKYFVPMKGDIQSRLEWLSGLLDSDGTVLSNPNSKMIQISNTNREFLNRTKLMLTLCGVQAKVTKNRSARKQVSMPGGRYDCKALYRLLINSQDTWKLRTLGLKSYHHNLPMMKPQRDARRFVTVKTVQKSDVADIVYCFTDHKNHTGTFNGVVTGQCGEQSLESYELCCLVESFPIKHDTKEDYFKTLKYAYLYAKTVTLLRTHDSRTNQVMTRNRRIGLSQSGIVENINKIGFREHMNWCDEGYEVVKKWDKAYSEWLGIPESIKKTTVKPSGTVSLLPGVTPGVHYPHSEYYIRRIRVAKTSHLCEAMAEAGYEVVPDIKEPDYTMVVSFPVHEPNFSKRKEDVYMYEQLELAAQLQAFWSDNQVSITVTVDEEEGKEIATALSMYEARLKSVSFLPLTGHDYEQAPYEEITKEEYEKKTEKLKRPKLNIGLEDEGKLIDRFCDTEVCEI